jgi:hypothetical protein
MLRGKFQGASELIIGIDSYMYINEAKTKSVFPSRRHFSDQEASIISKESKRRRSLPNIQIAKKKGQKNRENI